MQQPGFIFGGDTNWSYDELQRKRRIAEGLRASNTGTPRDVGEGLAAIGRALAARRIETQADKRDTALRGEFDARFDSLFGAAPAGPSYGQPVSPAPSSDPNNPATIGTDAMRAIGKMPTPDGIVAGLVERGLPEHIARGFAMNMQDESGLNPAINEISPLVPGSRGGFGLSQWTGPRRVALEKFAADRGKPVSDVDTQLDFLVSELQGPEAAAWSKIAGAQDEGQAAAAIATHFLRPAQEHLDRRVAAYTGGAGMQGFDPMVMAELAGSPYANPGQKAILEALMGQQMKAADPMYQLDLQRAQLELDALRNPQADPMAAIELQKAQLELAQMQNPQQKPTDDMREYEFAKSQGYEGTFQEYLAEMKKAGATNVTVGLGPGESSGDILAEASMTPETMVGSIDDILNNPSLDRVVGPLEGGGGNDVDQFGIGKRFYYGGAGLGLIQRINQLQNTTFLAARKMLKGGGAITDFESRKAEAAMARLSRAQSEGEFRGALQELRDAITAGAEKIKAAKGAEGVVVAPGAPVAGGGLSPEALKWMEGN